MPTPRAPLSEGAALRQIKWDTAPLNFPSNSLKTKKSAPNKVGHFCGHRTSRGTSIKQARVSLATSHSSPATVGFYSTIRMNRNRYISMKTKEGCHF
jgi:hypothetical protein